MNAKPYPNDKWVILMRRIARVFDTESQARETLYRWRLNGEQAKLIAPTAGAGVIL